MITIKNCPELSLSIRKFDYGVMVQIYFNTERYRYYASTRTSGATVHNPSRLYFDIHDSDNDDNIVGEIWTDVDTTGCWEFYMRDKESDFFLWTNAHKMFFRDQDGQRKLIPADERASNYKGETHE